jgi:aspartate-semialdehyde dehydrogenase
VLNTSSLFCFILMQSITHPLKIAIIGASGLAGQELIRLFQVSPFAYSLSLFASGRSAGKACPLSGQLYEPLDHFGQGEYDYTFLAIEDALAIALQPILLEKSRYVVDKSAAFRLHPDVPLVIPEVNGGVLSLGAPWVSSPNCTTTIACMALAPLHRAFGLKRVVAASYQSASGAGVRGLKELEAQVHCWSQGLETHSPEVFPQPLAFNVIPQVGAIGPGGISSEESKLLLEMRKILELKDLEVYSTCVRVPTLRAHGIAITAFFEKPLSIPAAAEAWGANPGLAVQLDGYATPLQASGSTLCHVGRVRQENDNAHTLSFFVVADQILKGASYNAYQIFEHLERLKKLNCEAII